MRPLRVFAVYRWGPRSKQPYLAVDSDRLVTWKRGELHVVDDPLEVAALASREPEDPPVQALLDAWGVSADVVDEVVVRYAYARSGATGRERGRGALTGRRAPPPASEVVDDDRDTKPANVMTAPAEPGAAACAACGEVKPLRSGGVCGACYWSEAPKAIQAGRELTNEFLARAPRAAAKREEDEVSIKNWKPKAKKACRGCGESFLPSHPKSAYCKPECTPRGVRSAKADRAGDPCPECGKPIPPDRGGHPRRRCSTACTNRAANRRYRARKAGHPAAEVPKPVNRINGALAGAPPSPAPARPAEAPAAPAEPEPDATAPVDAVPLAEVLRRRASRWLMGLAHRAAAAAARLEERARAGARR